jgi:hypothetical protein
MSTVIRLQTSPLLDERKILSPFDKRECLSLKEAAGVAGPSRPFGAGVRIAVLDVASAAGHGRSARSP